MIQLKLKGFQKELIRLLKRDWRFFLWTSWFLILGIGIGLSLPKQNPIISTVTELILQKFEKMQHWFIHAPLVGKIAIIWVNNILASFGTIALGILLLFPSIFILLENGIVLGIFQKIIGVQNGVAPIWFYLSLLPHGIFEIPALIIATALGIRFGSIPLRLLYYEHKANGTPPLFKDFFKDLRCYAVLIVIMLVVAAILEVTVSPYLVKMFGTKLIRI